MSDLDALVLGAGVTGLSIAAELAEAGLRVKILARNLPTDLDSTDFCSPWAGASFAPYATNEKELAWEKQTFEYFNQLAEEGHTFVAKTESRYGWNVEGSYGTPPAAAFLTNWRPLDPSACPRGTSLGVGFTSITLNPPSYLQHLLSRLASAPHPVAIERRRVSSIDDALALAPLVVNATGLGSLSLLGVCDGKMYPGMGQTVTVRAPFVNMYLSSKDPRDDGASTTGEQIYIIPRPASGGLVTLGGCFRPGDWRAHPDSARAERILQEAYGLCPQLAGHEEYQEGGWKRITVVSHNAGLRPCREGGARVEVEKKPNGTIVHAYGLGSSGYQWSKGVAEHTLQLVLANMNKARL